MAENQSERHVPTTREPHFVEKNNEDQVIFVLFSY
jgi:hypothetical protein